MPHPTDIEWTDKSSNLLRAIIGGRKGHICAKISPGCKNCYAEAINGRFGNQADYTASNARNAEHFIAEKEMEHILKFRPKGPYKGGTLRPKVFPFDMTDLFGEWNDDETINRMLAHFAYRSDVDWLVLTKRADRMMRFMTSSPNPSEVPSRREALMETIGSDIQGYSQTYSVPELQWPLPNVWLGVSAGTQKAADERIPLLLKTPAAVRFVSAEPLLERVELAYPPSLFPEGPRCCCNGRECGCMGMPIDPWPWFYPRGEGIDWVIVGGESGPKARPCNVAWIRSIVEQCKAADVPCFVKQLGANVDTTNGRGFGKCSKCGHIDEFEFFDVGGADPGNVFCTQCNAEGEHDHEIKDPKGGDPAEWPADLRVREFPKAVTA